MEQINERPLNWSTTNLTTFYGTLNRLSNGKKEFISLQKEKILTFNIQINMTSFPCSFKSFLFLYPTEVGDGE